MLPKTHIILGAGLSIILYFLFPQLSFIGAIIIFLASFLIDFDHYLYYVFLKKDINPHRAYRWFMKTKDKYQSLTSEKRKITYTAVCFFHGIEILGLLALLIFYSKIFLYILIGSSFHLMLDLIYCGVQKEMGHTPSLLYKFIKTRKFKHIDDKP